MALKIKVDYTPVVNLAMQQNGVHVIREIKFLNDGETPLHDISVCISFEPGFAEKYEMHIDRIDPGYEEVVPNPPLRFSTVYLSNVTERLMGGMRLEAIPSDGPGFEGVYEIAVLAFNEWGGTSVLPQMLAAFSTPNHPALTRIITAAGDLLGQWTGSASLDEYQTQDPDRVVKMMAALFNTIKSEGIKYATVPASFETSGQRIRLVDEVLGAHLGTCLDMAMLYAGCLEAMGLHPIVVLSKGHAFAGCWLVENSFADSVNDDPSLLTKRMASGINEILVVECTCMNAGNAATFEEACAIAEKKLDPEQFLLFLDIFRARKGHVRPLPMRVEGPDGSWVVVDEGEPVDTDGKPEDLGETDKTDEDRKVVVDRKTAWERKLLDLTMRNNLLRIRLTKDTLQIISVHIDKLEDELAADQDFRVLARPSDWDGARVVDGLHQPVNAADPVYGIVEEELKNSRIRTYLDELRVKDALTHLYRKSRTDMEENGANTLFLALGLLKYYETPKSVQPRYAPILLLPIEITRKSAASGYIIHRRDEETLLNITLLEYLRQEHDITVGGLNPLPSDESGVDVSRVFSTFRRKIMDMDRWDVVEQAIIGTFSFNKFILWNDIHNNTDALMESPVVSSLAAGQVDASLDLDLGAGVDLDEKFSAGDIELPIGADSSQLEAIIAALSGKSFVLHGPPGTGKSQTITNIISNALYRGKRVLFVAEKMAALEVVQSRLESIGLGAFCLELHSNKAKKSAVLAQLRRTTEVSGKRTSGEYAVEADQINAVRREMNAHVQSIHKDYPLGVSLYDCIARFCSIDEDCPAFAFSAEEAGSFREGQISAAEEALSKYKAACSVVGNPAGSALLGIGATEYSPEVLDAYGRIGGLKKECEDLYGEKVHLLDTLFGQEDIPFAEDRYLALNSLVSILRKADSTLVSLLKIADGETLVTVAELCRHGMVRDAARKDVLQTYDDSILALNVAGYDRAWREAMSKGFIGRFFATNSILKKLQTYSPTGVKPSKESVLPLLKTLSEYQREKKAAEALMTGPIAGVVRGCHEDWTLLLGACEKAGTILATLPVIVPEEELVPSVRNRIAATMAKGFDTTYPELFAKVQEDKAFVENRLSATFASMDEDWLQSLLLQYGKWMEGKTLFRSWIMYNQHRAVLSDLGVGTVAKQVEDGSVPLDRLLDSFRKGVSKAYAAYILTQDPSLNLFHGAMLEEKIARFRGLCKDFETLTRDELFARLASQLPALQTEAAQTSEVGILQRNIRNGCRGIALRRFFDMIPNLLPRMCPCMLMSPLSVAQYLDPRGPKFDLVIFDEASQMPTCEAVGAIARGKSIIVVGDQKQMPPTNFFNKDTFDEDNPEVEDLDSILDDCLALSFPSKHLRWHYRSKHESLIAFSNAKFYENSLLTFPSPDDLDTKLSYEHVDGIYDRGKKGTRQNRAEAEAVIAEIRRRLEDPDLRRRSIGVVTFNTNQQSLIEDLLTDLFTEKPDLEELAMSSEEPIFIKNLENVQGDERDVILFSVGYGKDKDGRVTMNFGPLNREGGWRRLNVAVSRARYEMKVFSTLTSDQIDLKSTPSEGVACLKAFLEYAERGRSALHYSTKTAIEPDGFVEAVAVELRHRGYTVRTNVGCSGYRIDIGIVDPASGSDYILGILCDGYNYSEARTARDREIVQIGILRKLGWKVVRLWSMDWWMDQEATMDALVDKIEKAMAGELEDEEEDAIRPYVAGVRGLAPGTSGSEGEDTAAEDAAEVLSDLPDTVIPYTFCEVQPLSIPLSDFDSGRYDHLLAACIQDIVRVEAPINRDLLYRRVLRACGIARTGTRVARHLDERVIPPLSLKYTDGLARTYWADDQDPDAYPFIRRTNERDASDIPLREILNAVLIILDRQIALPKEALIREMAGLFGYSRVGEIVRGAMLVGVDEAIEQGLAEEEGGKVRRRRE